MYIQKYLSPVGPLCMSGDGEHLTGLWFENSPDNERHKGNYVEKSLPVFEETARWLDVYFSGRQPDFTPPFLLPRMTTFRRDVADIMRKIPYGQTTTYGDIAAQLAQKYGNEKMSAQAVGGAVGWNPVCLIVPCHRVVGANGNLVGFGGGLDNKVRLLAHEGNDVTKFYFPKSK